MSRRKHSEEEPSNSERWLLTYSDLITLLMIFFVIMYAMSNVDAKKYDQLSQSLSSTLDSAATSGGGAGTATGGGFTDQTEANAGDEAADPELVAAAEKIRELLKEQGLQNEVSVNVRERGVVIGLMNTVLFEPGSAEIKEEAKHTLVAIGVIANDVHNYIRVEGNTDDVPMNTPQFPSNWELSVVRATNVLKLMINNSGVASEKISAVGYGEYRPSFPNTSAENRAHNRKVDIVILSDAYDKSESSLANGKSTKSTQTKSTVKTE